MTPEQLLYALRRRAELEHRIEVRRTLTLLWALGGIVLALVAWALWGGP